MIHWRRHLSLLLLMGICLLSGCGAPARAQQPSPWLQKALSAVSADTPYLLVMEQASTEQLSKRLYKSLNVAFVDLKAQHAAQATAEPSAEHRALGAFIEAFDGKLSPEGLRGLGFTQDFSSVLYGIGHLPTYRMRVGDSAKVSALIEQILSKGGVEIPRKRLGEQDYIGLSNDGIDVAIAFIGEDLIISVAPTTMAHRVFPIAFGQAAPAKPFQAAKLTALKKAHAFAEAGVGYLDLDRMLTLAFGEGDDLAGKLAREQASALQNLDATCKAEIRSLVRWSPRLIFGYRFPSPQQVESSLLMEVEPGLARDLMGLTTQVPGLGGSMSPEHLGEVAFGLDVNNLTALLAKRTAAAMKAPYRCALLAGANATIKEINAGVSQGTPPALSAFANTLRGAHAVLEDATLVRKKGRGQISLKGYLLVAHDTPMVFMGPLGLLLPPLAQAGLSDEGQAVDVALPQDRIGEIRLPHFAAAAQRGQGLIFGAGAGMKKRLAGLLAAPAQGPAPVFQLSYDTARVLEIAASLSPQGQAADLQSALQSIFGVTGYGLWLTEGGPLIRSSLYFR